MKQIIDKAVESVYDCIIREGNQDASLALNEFLKVGKLSKEKNKKKKLNNMIGNKNEIIKVCPDSVSSLYLPKRKVKVIPSNLISLNHCPNVLTKKFINEEDKNNWQFKNKNNYINSMNSNYPLNPIYSANPYESPEYLNFKTNFILKFSKNIETYNKFYKFFDIMSENKKKILLENFDRLVKLSNQKERILFDAIDLSNINDIIQQLKECTILFYEFELIWQKVAEITLKELKEYKEYNINLLKKVNDQENLLNANEQKIEYFKDFIVKNDLNYKSQVNKKKIKNINEIKDHYDKKEKFNQITIFRLEEEYFILLILCRIKDLTTLLDKNKEYYDKFYESLELIEIKKKEIDDLKIKYNQDLDDKKIRIAYLNNEKQELNLKINEIASELKNFVNQHEDSKKEFIEFHTQLKIMKQLLHQKNENICMISEEVETWKNELHKERLLHFETQLNVQALEIKLNGITSEKIINQNNTNF